MPFSPLKNFHCSKFLTSKRNFTQCAIIIRKAFASFSTRKCRVKNCSRGFVFWKTVKNGKTWMNAKNGLNGKTACNFIIAGKVCENGFPVSFSMDKAERNSFHLFGLRLALLWLVSWNSKGFDDARIPLKPTILQCTSETRVVVKPSSNYTTGRVPIDFEAMSLVSELFSLMHRLNFTIP